MVTDPGEGVESERQLKVPTLLRSCVGTRHPEGFGPLGFLLLNMESGGRAELVEGLPGRHAALSVLPPHKWVWWCAPVPSAQEADAGGLEIKGYPQPHSELKASIGFLKPCLKSKQITAAPKQKHEGNYKRSSADHNTWREASLPRCGNPDPFREWWAQGRWLWKPEGSKEVEESRLPKLVERSVEGRGSWKEREEQGWREASPG